RDRPLGLALDELAEIVTNALEAGLDGEDLLAAVVARAPQDDDACLLAVRWLGPRTTDGPAPAAEPTAGSAGGPSADEERAGSRAWWRAPRGRPPRACSRSAGWARGRRPGPPGRSSRRRGARAGRQRTKTGPADGSSSHRRAWARRSVVERARSSGSASGANHDTASDSSSATCAAAAAAGDTGRHTNARSRYWLRSPFGYRTGSVTVTATSASTATSTPVSSRTSRARPTAGSSPGSRIPLITAHCLVSARCPSRTR